MSGKAMSKWVLVIVAILIAAMLPGAVLGQTAVPGDRQGDAILVGNLESIGDGFIVINGQQIDTTGATSTADLVVGAKVEVKFEVAADGSLVAVSVGYPDVTELNFIGIVQALDSSSLTVAGIIFDITGATIADGVAVGSEVEIRFTLVDNAAVATEVRLNQDDDSDSDDNDEARLVGVLASIEGTTIVVGDLSIDISQAEVDDNLFVGALVEVDFRLVNGAPVAVDVSLYDSDDLEFSGVVEALEGTNLTVAGLVFDISNAEIDDDGELAVGVYVDVEYVVTDGGLIALEVEIEDDNDDDDNDDDEDGDDNNGDDDNGDDDDDDNCTVVPPAGWVTYVVKSGDTLSGIAVASNTSLTDLIVVNCISNPGAIAVGTSLWVASEITGDIPGNDDNGDDDNGDDDNDDNDDNGDDNDDNGDDDNSDDNGGDDNGGDDNDDNSDDNGDDDNGDDDNDDNGGDDDNGDDDNGDDD